MHVPAKTTWFVTGVFRNEDNIVFERTLDGQNELLEFLVPHNYFDHFIYLADYLVSRGYANWYKEEENRYYKIGNKS